jgi:DNA-binding response OmpR family regulator
MTVEKTILIIDDDPYLLNAIEDILQSTDYKVLKTDSGIEALKCLKEHTVHLILADIEMPGMNGYQLFQLVNENPQWVNIPFLFLSARALDSDIQFGKELGVDDYLTKPFDIDELLATIRGKIKRATHRASIMADEIQYFNQNRSKNLQFGNLRINLQNHQVWKNEIPVQLSALEFRLFAKLVQQPNSVIPHQVLIKITHQLDTDPQDASRLLRPLVRSIRRKLGYPTGNPGCIENLRSVGYQFNPQVS